MNFMRWLLGCGLIVIGVNVGATTDTTPDALKPPRNATLLLAAHGEGVQIYTCQSAKDDASRFSWTLLAPEASIADQDGKSVGKHYAGPTWEAGDGSKVVGEVIARDDGPDASAIPWLLLRAKSASGHGRLGAVTFIQRLHTVGGQSPTAGCSAATVDHVVRVNYSADYNFYVATGAAIASSAPTDPRTPLGLWETFDDKTGAARALIRIYAQDGKLFGRVEQSFTPGAEARVCSVCSDERKNQPIIGLIIIRNLQPDGNEYSGGDILDPESGSLYHCKLHLEDDGTRLVVRGYLGFSLLGRSQTWRRQP